MRAPTALIFVFVIGVLFIPGDHAVASTPNAPKPGASGNAEIVGIFNFTTELEKRAGDVAAYAPFVKVGQFGGCGDVQGRLARRQRLKFHRSYLGISAETPCGLNVHVNVETLNVGRAFANVDDDEMHRNWKLIAKAAHEAPDAQPRSVRGDKFRVAEFKGGARQPGLSIGDPYQCEREKADSNGGESSNRAVIGLQKGQYVCCSGPYPGQSGSPRVAAGFCCRACRYPNLSVARREEAMRLRVPTSPT